MPHCQSHRPSWVPMLTCSLSSPVEQRFSHFPPNPYKMSPREHHLSSRLKTMRWAPGRVRNITYLRGQRMTTSQHCGILFSWTFPLSPSHQELLLALGLVRHSAPGRSPVALDMMSPAVAPTSHFSLEPERHYLVGATCHQVLGEVSPSSPTLVSNLLCSTWATRSYLLCISSIIRVQFLTLRKCSMDKWVARDSQTCSMVYADIMPSMTMSF